MADDADRGERLVDARAHLLGLRVLAELLLDPLERLVDGDADDDEPGGDDEVRPSGQSSTPPVAFSVLLELLLLELPIRILTAVTHSAA